MSKQGGKVRCHGEGREEKKIHKKYMGSEVKGNKMFWVGVAGMRDVDPGRGVCLPGPGGVDG